MSNTTYHHGDLKSSLISSAKKILREKGADALSLRAIAADVGVSHMAPYAHFKNKKELMQNIAADGFNELAERMEANSQSITNARQLVLVYGATYIDFAINNPQLYRLMLGQVETFGRRKQNTEAGIQKPSVSNELEECFNRPFVLLRSAFAKGNDNREEVAAHALGAWSTVHGMAALIIEGHISIPEDTSTEEFLIKTASYARF